MSHRLKTLQQQETDLRAQFDKADAEHTANANRTQQSANRRWELNKQLRDVRARIAAMEAAPADEDETPVASPAST